MKAWLIDEHCPMGLSGKNEENMISKNNVKEEEVDTAHDTYQSLFIHISIDINHHLFIYLSTHLQSIIRSHHHWSQSAVSLASLSF